MAPDKAGNVYGTTQQGGGNGGGGTIFKLTNSGNLTTLYSFSQLEGDTESGVSLINGKLYGVVPGGPTSTAYNTLYSIYTDGSNFTNLYEMNKAQGSPVVGQLQPASSGGLFGIARGGGRYGHGTLFYFGTHNVFTVAHQFAGGTDGNHPNWLIEDSAGNLYGSTYEGGNCTARRNGCGVIFKYVPTTRTYSILYTFTGGSDGYGPYLGAVDSNGTLYGALTQSETYHKGALFTLTPAANGSYNFAILTPLTSRFNYDTASTPPALSPNGTLVGETSYGGTYTYLNGVYNIYYTPANTLSQVLIPKTHPTLFIATSEAGGTSSTCTVAYGCGFIYYGSR